jgi:hypothetical protein
LAGSYLRSKEECSAVNYLHGKDYSVESGSPLFKQTKICKSIIQIYPFQHKSISFEHHGELMNAA